MKNIFFILIIISLFIFNSCFTRRLSGSIEVKKHLANPIIIDFVFVFDESVSDQLQKVSSVQWFKKRNQYKLDMELNNKIQILTYELVPGQTINFDSFRPKARSENLLIYVSYLTPGDHRVVLKDYRKVDLILEKENFYIKVFN